MSVSDKVTAIIAEQLGVDAEEVTPKSSFTDDLGADSLDIVELVMAFEEEFGIEIPDEDSEKISTVKDAIDYIEEHGEEDDDEEADDEEADDEEAVSDEDDGDEDDGDEDDGDEDDGDEDDGDEDDKGN